MRTPDAARELTTASVAKKSTRSLRISLRDVALSELHLQSLPKKHVAAGAMLMHPDEKTESLYFILEGRIRLYRLSPAGEEVFEGELGPGDCLKCPRVLCEDDCHTFAEAIVDSTLEALSKPLFTRLTQQSATFNQALMREVAYQMVELDRRLYEKSVMPMRTRLYAELLRLARHRRDGTMFVSPPPTQQDLANRIGSQREAVSRELTRLAHEGIIRCSRSAISIIREGALRTEVTNWMDGGREPSE